MVRVFKELYESFLGKHSCLFPDPYILKFYQIILIWRFYKDVAYEIAFIS